MPRFQSNISLGSVYFITLFNNSDIAVYVGKYALFFTVNLYSVQTIHFSIDRKQIFFLYEYKAIEITRNISHVFEQDIVNECTVQYQFEKFQNGDTSLKNEQGHGLPSILNNDELKTFVEADPCTIAQ